jgi:hypothetical protein
MHKSSRSYEEMTYQNHKVVIVPYGKRNFMLGLEQCTYLNALTLTNYAKGFLIHGFKILN